MALRILCLALACLASCTQQALARPDGDHAPYWWVSIDLAAADLSYQRNQVPDDKTSFFLAFRGGYAPSRWLRVGVETNGFNIASSNLLDPGRGEGISQMLLLTAQVYPATGSGWFLKTGIGWNSYWNNAEGFRQSSSGAWSLGGGYEFRIDEGWDLAVFAQVHGGDVGNVDYDATSVGLSLTWKIMR